MDGCVCLARELAIGRRYEVHEGRSHRSEESDRLRREATHTDRYVAALRIENLEPMTEQAITSRQWLHSRDCRPLVVAEPRSLRQRGVVGFCRVADPGPDPRALLDDRILRHIGFRGDPILSRRPHTRAARIKSKTVVAALHLIVDQSASRQRIPTMRAPVVEGDDATTRRPEND